MTVIDFHVHPFESSDYNLNMYPCRHWRDFLKGERKGGIMGNGNGGLTAHRFCILQVCFEFAHWDSANR